MTHDRTRRFVRAVVPGGGCLPALLFALLLAPLLVAAPARGQTTPGAVAGRVVDAATGEPVGWAQILLEEANRSTDADTGGRFELIKIAPGLYTLKAYRIGYETLIRTVRVPAADTLRLTLTLTNTPVLAGELVVESERPNGTPQLYDAALELEGRQLRQHLGTTIAETLDDEPGISMRSMGPAPARPVLRGLGGERLLVLEDGGRTGDLSATSTDHAVVIDPLTAERIEVIRGPAALVYGSNTLGGVVNVVRGAVPMSRPDGLHAGLTLQGQSVNRGYSGGASVTLPAGPFALRADGSVRRAGDIRTPEGRLRNTGLRTYNASAGVGVRGARSAGGVAASLYGSTYGIPGGFVGAHPSGVDIELERYHVESRAEHLPRLGWMPRAEAQAAYTYYHHTEFEASGAVGTEFVVHSVDGSLLAHTSQYGPFRKGAIGVWGQYRDHAAGGYVFTPRSRELSLSGFAFQDVHFGSFTVQAGVRYDYRHVAPRAERQSDLIGLVRARSFGGVSAALSGLWHPARNATVGVSFMRSLRVPGIEELFSEGPHLAAYSFEVGNPELGLESGLGAELFARYESRRASGSVAVYRYGFDAYIFPRNTGEVNYRIWLPIYQFTGADARMMGAEASGTLRLLRRVTVEARGSYVRGTLVDMDQPLPWMPPLQGTLALNYRRGSLSLGVSLRGASAQERVGAFEDRTDGYTALDASAEYYVTAGRILHTFTLGVENLTDAVYRDHLSRVKVIMPEPGRNVKLLYRVYF